MTGAVYQREYLRRYRHAARIFGCCRDCGKPVDGKRRCEKHLAMHAARERRRHARHKAARAGSPVGLINVPQNETTKEAR